jgi:flagellar motor protein MotB
MQAVPGSAVQATAAAAVQATAARAAANDVGGRAGVEGLVYGGGGGAWSAAEEEAHALMVMESFGMRLLIELEKVMVTRGERRGKGRGKQQQQQREQVQQLQQQQEQQGQEQEQQEQEQQGQEQQGQEQQQQEQQGQEQQGQEKQQFQQRQRQQFVKGAPTVRDDRGVEWSVRDVMNVMRAASFTVGQLSNTTTTSTSTSTSSSSSSSTMSSHAKQLECKRRAVAVTAAAADMLLPVGDQLHPRYLQVVVEAFAAVGLKEHPLLDLAVEGLSEALKGSAQEGPGGGSGLSASPVSMASLGEALHKLGRVVPVRSESGGNRNAKAVRDRLSS